MNLGRVDVDAMLDEIEAPALLKWMAFLAVRQERIDEARRDREQGLDDDDEVVHWGED